MATFLIARLTPHSQSLVAVECLQKNNICFRISSNIPLMEFLMTCGGGEGRLVSATAVHDDIEPGKEEVHVISQMTDIFSTVTKIEVDSSEIPHPIQRPIKEEEETSESGQPDGQNPRLEMPSDAVLTEESVDVPMAAPENPSPIDLMDVGQVEDEMVDDHQEERDEEMNSFLNQPAIDEGIDEDVLLAADYEFNGNHAEMSFDHTLTAAEQGDEPVRDDVDEELHVDQHFQAEEAGEEDEQRMEDAEEGDMTVDEPLGDADLDVSMILQRDDDFPAYDVTHDEEEIKDNSKAYDEETDEDDKMEELEAEEEELIEEQEHEEKEDAEEIREQPDEDSEGDEMVDEEVDSDEEEDSNDEEDSSDEEEEESHKKQIVQKKRRDRPCGNAVGRRLFICPVKNCTSSYSTIEELEEHVKIHPGKQNFFCDVCKKNFSSKNAAIMHIQERKNKECCGCGKKFRNPALLVKHLRCHTGEKPFVCKTCGKGFAQINGLKRHMLTHTGQKLFACGFCKKSFALKENLKKHEMTHTGEKPFKCNRCDYRCSQRVHLKVHNRIHTGEKPYSCGSCKKRFTHETSLKTHEMTHTGEKPFKCPYCDYGSTQKGNLRAHILIHTGEKPFSCTKCDKKFTRSEKLKDHMKSQHHS